MRRAELFPFFAGLSRRGRDEFGALRATHAKAGQQLLERGDPANGAYFVLQGALRVYYVTDEGREATLYRVESGGACILALSSTLLDQPYPAWVEAGRKGGTALRLPSAAFHRFMENEPAFRTFVLNAMSSRIFELMGRLEEVASSTITRRVAAYLARNAGDDGEVVITQAALATELGTAREVVFRALRELTASGLIVTRRGRIRLLDARRLGQGATKRL